jgi:hypothetical protein
MIRFSPSLRTIAPVAMLAATGCLATQGSVRTLQDEIRASRSQLAQNDSAILRAEDARRREIASLAASVDRLKQTDVESGSIWNRQLAIRSAEGAIRGRIIRGARGSRWHLGTSGQTKQYQAEDS